MSISFSIIIPCYNQAHYLKDSVQSVVDQSFTNWQLIIVDDGATDHTYIESEKWKEADQRIEVLHQTNQGLAAARNNGLELARGQYVLFLDADDKLKLDALDKFAKALDDGADIAVCGYNYFNDAGNIHHEVKIDCTPRLLLTRNIAPPVAFAMKRSALSDTGLFDKSFNPAEDWDIWCRFYKAGKKFAVLNNIGVDYRVVDTSMSRNAAKMYHGMKMVSLQSIRYDHRILKPSALNKNYSDVDFNGSIRHSMAICLGLMIMQGKVDEALALYNSENSALGIVWQPQHYAPMNSYLSFRYYNSRPQLKKIFRYIHPHFENFFQALSISKSDRSEIMNLLFRQKRKLYERKRYGVMARLIQRMFTR